MLLKADEAGPARTGERMAEAFDSRTRTVEKLLERFVTDGFEQRLDGKQRDRPATAKGRIDSSARSLAAQRLHLTRKDVITPRV